MIFPSSCLHFGPTQNHIMTEGTSQKGQADRAQELLKRIRQEEEELRQMHGEEEEILPSPMLLQELEEAGLSLPTPVSRGLIPTRRRSGLPPSVSATSTSTTFQHRSSQPELGAARFLCPVRDSSPPPLHSSCSSPAQSRRTRRRRRCTSVPVSEGCANACSSLPEGWITASRLFLQGFCSTPPLLLLRRVGSTPRNYGRAQPAHSGSCRAIHVSSSSC
ncbi:hypothetical protein CRENBAI_016337 [Crenichthys baileyi]|uniref:Uncharacterized protein n=1 Tax=Crenichthys baileyi TaxID=28760 RepID=A0AAV9RQZ1_9TELE